MRSEAADSLQAVGVQEVVGVAPVAVGETVAKPVVKRQAAPVKHVPAGTMTKADSAYFAPVAKSFEAMSKDFDQITAEVSTTYTWRKEDSQAVEGGSPETVATTAADMKLEPLGHSLLSPYRAIALTTVGLSLLLVLIVKASRSSVLGEVFSFLTDYMAWKRMTLSTSLFGMFSLRALDVMCCVVFSVFCIECVLVAVPGVALPFNGSLLLSTVVLSVAVLMFYVFRFLTDRMIGYAFNIEEKVTAVSLCKAGAVALIGLCLLPVVGLMPFLPISAVRILIFSAVAMIAVLTLLRIYRTIRINLNNLGNFFYLLLYLCIVEAAPLVCLFYVAKGI